jgi:hypothetical protein
MPVFVPDEACSVGIASAAAMVWAATGSTMLAVFETQQVWQAPPATHPCCHTNKTHGVHVQVTLSGDPLPVLGPGWQGKGKNLVGFGTLPHFVSTTWPRHTVCDVLALVNALGRQGHACEQIHPSHLGHRLTNQGSNSPQTLSRRLRASTKPTTSTGVAACASTALHPWQNSQPNYSALLTFAQPKQLNTR